MGLIVSETVEVNLNNKWDIGRDQHQQPPARLSAWQTERQKWRHQGAKVT